MCRRRRAGNCRREARNDGPGARFCDSDGTGAARSGSGGAGAIIAGGIGAVLLFLGLFFDPFQFYHSYLWSYVFCVGIALGSMAWLMLQYLSGGAWGVVIRRPAEAAARTLPLLALMFLPI